jgi:hypothetical protein
VSYSLKSLLRMVGLGALVLGLCLALVLGLAGCGDDGKGTATTVGVTVTDAVGSTVTSVAVKADATALIGKWQSASAGETLEFAAEGKMIWTGKGKDPSPLTYAVERDTIVIQIEATKNPRSLQFSIAGDTLTTQNAKDESVTYTRVQ